MRGHLKPEQEHSIVLVGNVLKTHNHQINCDHLELRPKKQASAQGGTLLKRYAYKERYTWKSKL